MALNLFYSPRITSVSCIWIFKNYFRYSKDFIPLDITDPESSTVS